MSEVLSSLHLMPGGAVDQTQSVPPSQHPNLRVSDDFVNHLFGGLFCLCNLLVVPNPISAVIHEHVHSGSLIFTKNLINPHSGQF
jgi:hypothetical protein